MRSIAISPLDTGHNNGRGLRLGSRQRGGRHRLEGLGNRWGLSGGGVVTHTLPALERPEFMQYFKRRGRFAELMEQIPIHVITTRAALVGAADYSLGSAMRVSAGA